jgi:hypothetical protein
MKMLQVEKYTLYESDDLKIEKLFPEKKFGFILTFYNSDDNLDLILYE